MTQPTADVFLAAIHEVREDLRQLRAEMVSARAEMVSARAEMSAGLDRVNGRIDRLMLTTWAMGGTLLAALVGAVVTLLLRGG